MRKDENGKEKGVVDTGRTIWTAVLIINVILILIKLFNVFYFKHSFVEEFNDTYFMLLIPTFLLFIVQLIMKKRKNKIFKNKFLKYKNCIGFQEF